MRYLMLLIVSSAVPLYLYNTVTVRTNRDRLKTNEMLLENTITRALADDIAQRQINLHAGLSNLASAIQVESNGNLSADRVATPKLRALLEQFVYSSDSLAYATLLNADAKGISASRLAADVFPQWELQRAFAAAREGRVYNGQTLSIGARRANAIPMLNENNKARWVPQDIANEYIRAGREKLATFVYDPQGLRRWVPMNLVHQYIASGEARLTLVPEQPEQPTSAPAMLVGVPLTTNGRFIGMVAVAVDLEYLARRLQDVSQGGLVAYVVDRQGKLVAGSSSKYAIGQDMTNLKIVKNWVEVGVRTKRVTTDEFTIQSGKSSVAMLGTYSPVATLDWAAVTQEKQQDAYRGVYEMQHNANLLALVAMLLSLGVSLFTVRRITGPPCTITDR
jgi:hypothetical protein